MQKNTRQLAAVMFTDMVGYTALMQENEQKAKKNRDRHRNILENSVQNHHGIILQYYGDGTLCVFNSAIEAVECATEIQQELQKEPKIPLRIGLHIGDIVYTDDGIYGDAVNIASRIETLATPGCVLISGKLFDEIKNHPSMPAQPLGEFELKNVKRPVHVFALQSEGLNVPFRDELKLKPRESEKSIAVLPFVNMSTDAENEYFSDGITEELLNALTKVDGLQVTSRTSSFAFKGKNLDVREIGSKLAVTSVLEGSVRKAGNKVRITAQLINASDGYHVWSEVYDRDLEDIFAVQDEISKQICNKLREKLSIDQIDESIVKTPTKNLDAHNLYLKGRFYFYKWNPEDAKKALVFLRQAIDLEPDFASAYAALSGCYCLIGAMGQQDTVTYFKEAKVAALQSIELDNTLAESHTSLGAIQFWNDWDIAGAKKSYEKALELNSNYADAYHGYAMVLLLEGKTNDAINEIEKALQLDPLSLPINSSAGMIHFCAEKYTESLAYYEKTLEYDPTFQAAMEGKGWVFALTGEMDKAIETFKQLYQLTAQRVIAGLGYVYAKKGDKKEAEKYLNKLKKRQELDSDASLNTDLAIVYTGLNDIDKVFHYLEKSIGERVGTLFLNVHPGWKFLRSDPRFINLIKKAGLPE